MRAAVTPAMTPYEHIEGHWQANAPVGQWSWFGAGGNAAMLFEPFNTDQLRKFSCGTAVISFACSCGGGDV